MQRRGGGVLLILVGLLVGAVGYGIGHYMGLPTLQHAKASLQWPSVTGTVTSSRVDREVKRRTRTQRGGTMYRHRVEYSYEVNGKSRIGNVVWFGDGYSSSSLSSHQAVVDRYPSGKELPVYYDPDHPEVSVLEPGASFSSYLVYVIGWILLAIAAVLLLGGLKSIVGNRTT